MPNESTSSMNVGLAFVHTSPVHVPTFTRLVDEEAPGTPTRHWVLEQLLCDAQTAGAEAPALVRRIQRAMMDAAADGARVVVCTCSTIGGAAERTPTGGRFRALRIDRAMADRAVRSGPRILVVAALESTLGPTQALLQQSAAALDRSVVIEPLLLTQAWGHFERGDRDDYIAGVEAGIRHSNRSADVIVLAQASMAPAAERLADLGTPVLSSPRLGVRAAIEALDRPF